MNKQNSLYQKLIGVIYKFALKLLPAKCTAFLDFYLGVNPKDDFSGPFNGQIKRQEIFREIQKTGLLNAIIETGTYRGTTTEFFLTQATMPVYTVEIVPDYYFYAYLRLRKYKNAHFFLGDSVTFLRKLQASPDFNKKGILFYLDAHKKGNLPLREEIGIIAGAFSESVIIIDDFCVPGDTGYGFDDYGGGDRLCLEYLEMQNFPNLETFFPAAPSTQETGKKRGCVILATKDLMFERAKMLKTLRPYRHLRGQP